MSLEGNDLAKVVPPSLAFVRTAVYVTIWFMLQSTVEAPNARGKKERRGEKGKSWQSQPEGKIGRNIIRS